MSFRATPVEKLNDEISTAGQALAAREALKGHVANNKLELSRLNERVRKLKNRLRQEERSFNKFDRVSLPSLIHGVLGTREVRRKAGYDEWQRIREALLDAMAERDEKVEFVRDLQVRWSQLENAPELLDRALERKARWLRDNDHEAGGRLWELDQGERELHASLRKIERALESNRRETNHSRPTVLRQLHMLQDMHERKVQRLRRIWEERRTLLFDGARVRDVVKQLNLASETA